MAAGLGLACGLTASAGSPRHGKAVFKTCHWAARRISQDDSLAKRKFRDPNTQSERPTALTVLATCTERKFSAAP